MKKLFVVFGLAAISAMAADVTGFIMDKKCSSNKAMVGNEACAKRCIGGGAEAVLATEDGKIYAISNQDKVKDAAGKKVTVTGKVEGDSITVESVKM
jgi:nitrite reductase/ring-hydroxylating ferredoxin subunit